MGGVAELHTRSCGRETLLSILSARGIPIWPASAPKHESAEIIFL